MSARLLLRQLLSRCSGAACGWGCCSACWWPPSLGCCSPSQLSAERRKQSLGMVPDVCVGVCVSEWDVLFESEHTEEESWSRFCVVSVCSSAFKAPGPESSVFFTAARSFSRNVADLHESTCEWTVSYNTFFCSELVQTFNVSLLMTLLWKTICHSRCFPALNICPLKQQMFKEAFAVGTFAS